MQLYNGGLLGRANQYRTIAQPQYVGGYTISFGSTASSKSIVLTSLSGGIATAPQPGDFLIWGCTIAETGAASPGATASTDGFLYTWVAFSTGEANGVNDTNFIGRYAHITTTLTSFTLSHSATVANSTGSSFLLQVWRNIDQLNPIVGAASTASLTNSILGNPPVQTSSVANSVYVSITGGAHTAGASASYSSADLTNFLTSSGASLDSDSIIGGGYILTTTGGAAILIDPPALTFSTTNSTNYSSRSASILLRPAVAPTGIFNVNAVRR